MGLTAVAIKAAKGRGKPYKVSDSGGLYLLVTPSGQRYWHRVDDVSPAETLARMKAIVVQYQRYRFPEVYIPR